MDDELASKKLLAQEHIRVLLVEDDEDDYILTRDLLADLKNNRFTVDWISNCEQALEIMIKNTYDVYLVDYRLGACNGIELIKTAIRDGCKNPIIMLTGDDDIGADTKAIRAGAEDYLSKSTLETSLLERSIRYAIDRVKRKELAARKDEFISLASHELKTPVTSIKVFAQLLQKKFEARGEEESVNYLQKMNDQINRLIKLISDLLDISKIQTGKLELQPTRFPIDALILDLVEIYQQTFLNHDIILKGKASKPVYADKDRISQVLVNLMANSVKFSPKGEKIVIHVESDAKEVKISVQDFGIGIPKDQRDKIFEKLYRVNGEKGKTFPGMGIGLYISSQIVKRHGGRIWVDSEPGKGSTFSFTLPLGQYKQKNTRLVLTA